MADDRDVRPPAACGPDCPAAAEVAAVRARAAELLARPWRGPETTAVREAVREILNLQEGQP